MKLTTLDTPTASRRRRLRVICPCFPTFNIYSRPARTMTALGPVCIATAVQDIANWDAEVIDENNYRRGPMDEADRPDHEALQAARRADVVGLYGGLTSTIPRLYALAKQYKAMGVRTIAGGHHFVDAYIGEALHNGVDVLVLGEGEQTITELLGAFDVLDSRSGDVSDAEAEALRASMLGAIPGIAFLRDGEVVQTTARAPITDFDQLPLPDFSVLRNATMKIYPVSGVRGCAMKCEFCAVKGKPRFATASRMLSQFTGIYEKWGGKVFFIVDDLFGQNRRETLELCRMLKAYQDARGVRFSIMVQIRLDRARDTELLTAMREAGVGNVAIGFESPIAEELEVMQKHLKPEIMIDQARTYRRAGFRVHGMFIFGYPPPAGVRFEMSVAERVKRFRTFIGKAGLDTVQVLLPIPLPGTDLTRRLEADGRVFPTESVGLEYYDGNFPLYQPDEPLTPENMQRATQQIMRGFYGPRHFATLLVHLIAAPTLPFWMRPMKTSWQRWRRAWLRTLYRCSGWLVLRQWTAAFRHNAFMQKLAEAKDRLASKRSDGGGSSLAQGG